MAVEFNDNNEEFKPTRGKEGVEVDIIQGKIVSVLDKNDKIVEDPKFVIGKRKGFLVTIGLLKSRKFIGILDEKGNLIQDKNQIAQYKKDIQNKKMVDVNGTKIGVFDSNGDPARNTKINIDEQLLVQKNGEFVGTLLEVEKAGKKIQEFRDQYDRLQFTDKLVRVGGKAYLVGDSGMDIDTSKVHTDLTMSPKQGILKAPKQSVEQAQEEAKKIGKSLTSKQIGRKEWDQQNREWQREQVLKNRRDKTHLRPIKIHLTDR